MAPLIRDEQTRALARMVEEEHKARLRASFLPRLREEFPVATSQMSDTQILTQIDSVIAAATRLRVYSDSDIYRLLCLSYLTPRISDPARLSDLLSKYLTAVEIDPTSRITFVEKQLFVKPE
jgi:hypothetical protein